MSLTIQWIDFFDFSFLYRFASFSSLVTSASGDLRTDYSFLFITI